MLLLCLKRMLGNKGKTLAMLAGLILAAAMAFAVPIYSKSIMQKMLNTSFSEQLKEENRYPAYFYAVHNMRLGVKDAQGEFDIMTEAFDTAMKTMGVPTLVESEYIKYDGMYRVNEAQFGSREQIRFYWLKDIGQHINLISGRMFNPDRNDGVVEAIVTPNFLVRSPMIPDVVYDVYCAGTNEFIFKLEIVGVFSASDDADPYWYTRLDSYPSPMFVDNTWLNSFVNSTEDNTRLPNQYQKFAAIDYTKIDIDKTDDLLGNYRLAKEEFENTLASSHMNFFAEEKLEEARELKSKVYVTLYSAMIPLIIMTAFYVIMISVLKLESEQDGISVMQSRGAERKQILWLYMIESLIMMAISCILGPLLGLLVCKVIGASNGFLTFSNRSSISLVFTPTAFLSLLICAIGFVIISLIPAFIGAGVSIVQRKRVKANKIKKPFYLRYYLDIICLALGLYGWYTMKTRIALAGTEKIMSFANADFTVYISGTLLAMGAGMLFLRIYPYIIGAIYALFGKIMSAPVYFTFNRLSRSREYITIMLFVIMTISIGVSGADTARSINTYLERNVTISAGADLVYRPVWLMYAADGTVVRGRMHSDNIVDIVDENDNVIQRIPAAYREILPGTVDAFEGVEHAARVYYEDRTTCMKNKSKENFCGVMLTDPYDFAQTAINVPGMNQAHLNTYCNALTKFTNGCIISQALADSLKLELGDTISFELEAGPMEGYVVAVVNAWPGIESYYYDAKGELHPKPFLIADLSDYLETHAVRPYEFFIKKTEGTADIDIYNALNESSLGLVTMTSLAGEMNEMRSQPVNRSTNGILTVSFLAITFLMLAGFVIYWIISVEKRSLSFGISRALGMNSGGVILILMLEQILVSLVAVIIGILIGRIQSVLFVGFMGMNYTIETETVAFHSVTHISDLGRLLGIVGIGLALCIIFLFITVIRQKVDRILKLGED